MYASPVFLLGTTIATLAAALFQLTRAGSLKQAILFWFAAVIGFFAGNGIGSLFFRSWPTLGQVNIIPALVLCLVAMFVVMRRNV